MGGTPSKVLWVRMPDERNTGETSEGGQGFPRNEEPGLAPPGLAPAGGEC